MKRCPECRRDYFDETLVFCLDDGVRLLDGPASEDPATAIQVPHSTEAPTREFNQSDESYRLHRVSNKNSLIAGLIGILFVAILGVGYFYYVRNGATQIDSIAVLPFENGSGDPSMEYLSDGVSDGVIDRLSALPQLKVIARNSSFKYRDQNGDLTEIANALGVRAVVTGRVIQRGDGYVIRVDLIDARENKQLWGESFSRKTSDLELLQADISREIADELQLRLSGNQEARLTARGASNPQAYELLLKGRYHANSRVGDNPRKALEYYEQAVALEPNFALAQAYLANGYFGLIIFNLADPSEVKPKFEAAARRALELDDKLAEAHQAMGIFYMTSLNWAAAESEYKRAAELNPNYPWPHLSSSAIFSRLGQHENAIAEAKRGRELDPVSAISSNYVFGAQMWARQYDQALAGVKGRLESDPDNFVLHWFLAEIYSEMGSHREAIAEWNYLLTRQATDPGLYMYFGAAYAAVGERGKAKEVVNNLETGGNTFRPATWLSCMLRWANMSERSLCWRKRLPFAIRGSGICEYVRDSTLCAPIRDLRTCCGASDCRNDVRLIGI